MPEVVPVHLEATMIEGVDELVRERLFEVALVVELVLADEDAIICGEAA